MNLGKTKVVISGSQLDTLRDSGRHPYGVCKKGVAKNSIYFNNCSHWFHKRCSNIKGKLTPDPKVKCSRCLGTALPIDGRPCDHVVVDGHNLEVVDSFCYLGDTISAGSGCEAATITRVRTVQGKFTKMLPILSCKTLSPTTQGRVYNTCIRSAMLNGSECEIHVTMDVPHKARGQS